jgi:hypothetical protein
LSIEIPKLIGREKKHYEALESLYAFSCNKPENKIELCSAMKETIDDWDKLMGGKSNLLNSVQPYLEGIAKSDQDTARLVYLFLSPVFFYIHILYEMKRRSWRMAITWGGIFCERIVRNIFQEIDRKDSLDIWQLISKDRKFENRNNRLRKELEERGFKEADSLWNFLKSIYFTRSHTGPHDVPPPEPIQADYATRLCAPAYLKYLESLILLDNKVAKDFQKFVSFFYNLAKTRIALIFPEEETPTTLLEVLKELYCQGFFKDGKLLSEVNKRLVELRYNFRLSKISNTLKILSQGKNAMLTRKGRVRFYRYYERYPPEKFFKIEI